MIQLQADEHFTPTVTLNFGAYFYVKAPIVGSELRFFPRFEQISHGVLVLETFFCFRGRMMIGESS